MGLTQSLQKLQKFDSYHNLIKKQHDSIYFGSSLQIYRSKFNPKQHFTKHTISFSQSKQMKNFIQQVKKLTTSIQIPFNILHPVNIFIKSSQALHLNNISNACSNINNEVTVIHKRLNKTLEKYVKQRNNQLNQKTIWFIINEISKSLQMLQQKNHASYYLMPENVFCNNNENWFIYDGFFVVGNQGSDELCKRKLKMKSFMSDDFKKKIQANSIITNADALFQDIYCFGYTIIYMMTGINPKQMPDKPHQRDNQVHDLLDDLLELQQSQKQQQYDSQKYSAQLIGFVKNLIKNDPRKRFSIRHIRSCLKTKQQQIFINQQQQWSRTTLENHPIHQNGSRCQYDTASKMRKIKSLKSSQKLYQKTLLTQNSQQTCKNMTSMRTLKKQPHPHKLVLMNSKDIPSSFPISLNQNQYRPKNPDRSGQVTPIRNIDDVSSHHFIANKNTFPNNQNKFQLISNTNKEMHLRQFNSPRKQGNQVTFISPHKHSSTSINPQLTTQNHIEVQYRNLQNIKFQQKRHYAQENNVQLISSSRQQYQNVFQSPTKVKMTYCSPPKGNY